MNNALERFIREVVEETMNELDVEEVENISDRASCRSHTHSIKSCTIDGEPYYLKFSDPWETVPQDPSLQLLVEYLAYRVYQLYGVRVPKKIYPVFNGSNGTVGLATRDAGGGEVPYEALGQMLKSLEPGILVDILLANWDVTSPPNLVWVDEEVVRIDPGGALTYRAQGARKGEKFSDTPGELDTMLTPITPAGDLYSGADLQHSATVFNSVSKEQLLSLVREVESEVSSEMEGYGDTFANLNREWQEDVGEIYSKLSSRWDEIKEHLPSLVA